MKKRCLILMIIPGIILAGCRNNTTLSESMTEEKTESTPTPEPEITPEVTVTPELVNIGEEAQNFFEDFISQRNYEEALNGWDIDPTEYALIDIDQDGITELIINANYDDGFALAAVFAYDGTAKAAEYIGDIYHCYELKYSSEYKALVYSDTRPNEMETVENFDVLEDGSLVNSFSISWGQAIGVFDTDEEIEKYRSDLVALDFKPIVSESVSSGNDNSIDLIGCVGMSVEVFTANFADTESRIGYDGTMIYVNDSFEADSILEDGEPKTIYRISLNGVSDYSLAGVKIGMEFAKVYDILAGNGYSQQDKNTYISPDGVCVNVYPDERDLYVKSVMAIG